ncbi:protein FAM200C-like [Palaemon carinicauda]|uniref:protein FAM200C-like n=1 Tax=Palaemon carinicauda TaxID=392227 RepID=UPI0035B61FC2
MQFLRNQGSEIADHFENREFILSLAYLADVFMHLDELNVSIQGTAMNMITAREKLSALTKKLPMWIKSIESGNFANFPSLDEAASAEEELPILSEVKEHLQELIQSFQGYFHLEEGSVAQRWIRDPFLFNLDSMDDNDIMKDDLVELQTNDIIRMEFEKMQLDMFWCAQLQAFPQLARRALEVLVPFTTTYLCEAGFSTLLHIKTKARNRLDASDDMRLALSKKEPRLNNIINEKQQKSH